MLLLFLFAWSCARDDPLLAEGRQHFHNREYQAAIEILQRVVQGPSPPQAVYRYLGRCYLQVGQYEQARETAHAGLARAPELYDLLCAIEMTRAFAEARYSETDAALRAFQRAIELDPQRATTSASCTATATAHTAPSALIWPRCRWIPLSRQPTRNWACTTDDRAP